MQEGGDKERYALESLILHAIYHLRDGPIPKAMQGRWLGVKLCTKEPVMGIVLSSGHLAFLFQAVVCQPSAGTTG